MSINQLEDDGAVIGYKPTLEYKKESNGTGTIKETTSSSTDYSGKTNYSQTLQSFKNNLPSKAISNIDYVIGNMKLLVDKLASSFENGRWNQYGDISSLLSAVESTNDEYITKFINAHRNEITGSIIPELIGEIYDTQQRLEILEKTLKELYYGNSNLTYEEVSEIDDAYLQKLNTYEITNEQAKINYLALSFDSILNRSVSMYAFSVNEKAIDIADVITKTDNSNTDQSKAELIKSLFTDINNDIEYRKTTYKEQQSVEIMQKTLYNYYDKRKNIIDLYDIFGSNPESIFIGKKIQSYKSKVDESITNVNRTFAGNQHYLSEISKMEQEKHFLMNIYETFNYNSEN